MIGRTFTDISHGGAMALRDFVDRKSKQPYFNWYQRTYARIVLRKFLTRHRILEQGVRQSTGRGLRRQASLDQLLMRRVAFDHSTLNQINMLLDGKLSEEKFPALSKKIDDMIHQLSISSSQRNALVALFNYINAQGSIALGYTEDILTPKDSRGDVISAIGWTLWTLPFTGPLTWGAIFAKRVKYVSSQGGDITFILPEGRYGYTFTAQGAFTSFYIWEEILKKIDSMDPIPNYQFMLFGVMESSTLSKINDQADFKNLYTYCLFRCVYGASNEPNSGITNTPIDKSAIEARIEAAIKASADKNFPMDNQLGATSHFEFAYLLHAGYKFRMVGTEGKIQSFMNFSTGKQDPIEQKFRDRMAELEH
ncbi:MAG: hypothetical protein LBD34_03385 [Puniceicoccales bacterium]|jgi:hypothetical protein|nr:hypothetical protein [Puniceicoccales bacterium]